MLGSGLAITDFSVARYFDLFAARLQDLTPSSPDPFISSDRNGTGLGHNLSKEGGRFESPMTQTTHTTVSGAVQSNMVYLPRITSSRHAHAAARQINADCSASQPASRSHHKVMNTIALMTEYQLGNAIVLALRAAGLYASPELNEFRTIEIVADPQEGWLQGLPADQIIPKELALEAVAWANLKWENEKYKADDDLVESVERYLAAKAPIQEEFEVELKVRLGYQPDNKEIAAILGRHKSLLEAKIERGKVIWPLTSTMRAEQAKAEIARREAKETPYDRRIREWKATDEYKEWKLRSDSEERRLADDMNTFRAWMLKNDPNRRK